MSEEEWEETLSLAKNGEQVARVIRHRMKGDDISNYPELQNLDCVPTNR